MATSNLSALAHAEHPHAFQHSVILGAEDLDGIVLQKAIRLPVSEPLAVLTAVLL